MKTYEKKSKKNKHKFQKQKTKNELVNKQDSKFARIEKVFLNISLALTTTGLSYINNN